jgi:tetratricopeptide (TPR) repeat protein
VARAYYGVYAPGLTVEQRARETQQAAADAMDASVGELLLVLALRAPPGPERRSLLKSAAEAVPDDPHVLYLHAASLPSLNERVRAYETMNRRFPDFAPAYNSLAYARARDLGDVAGGLSAAQQYVQLASKNPNSHDTFAELLQWAGRFDESTEHYQQALDFDAGFWAAHSGLAEVALLQGNAPAARAHYGRAIQAAPPQARLNLELTVATTFIADGDIKTARSQLLTFANSAEGSGNPALAAQAHRNLAVMEAALGNRTLVDSHLRKANMLTTGAPNLQRVFAAAAYALAGDLIGARPFATAFTEAATASGSPLFRRQAQGLDAVLQITAGNDAEAASAAAAAGVYGALAKALLAETLKKQGKLADARALAAEVMATHQVDIFTVIAKQRARKI